MKRYLRITQLKRTTRVTLIMETDAYSNAVEVVEEGPVVVEVEKEAGVEEKIETIRKEIVANNTTDSIFGKLSSKLDQSCLQSRRRRR